MAFASLGLSHNIVRGARAAGYTEPTPIQAQAIPAILAGRDVIGTAQTGTGKTAAFVLPILDLLKDGQGLRCLILTPTRELAAQIETNVRDYARFLPQIRCAALYGGVSMGPQISELRRGVDIIVATPGRLLDHLRRRTLDLRQIQIFVLDEADRMLDMGFMPDIKRIISLLPKVRQSLLFSATMPPEIESFARRILTNPVIISVGPRATPVEGVSQFLYPVPKHLKFALLKKLLEITPHTSVLIFMRTKRGAYKLAHALHHEGHKVAQIHGDRTQSQRSAALHGFRTRQYSILVATDIAARGLDIENISHVINYDVPARPEDYIHRIGRTARASAIGDAFTLCSPEEHAEIRAIERALKKTLPRVILPDFDYGKGGATTACYVCARTSAAPDTGLSRDGLASPTPLELGWHERLQLVCAQKPKAALAPRSALEQRCLDCACLQRFCQDRAPVGLTRCRGFAAPYSPRLQRQFDSRIALQYFLSIASCADALHRFSSAFCACSDSKAMRQRKFSVVVEQIEKITLGGIAHLREEPAHDQGESQGITEAALHCRAEGYAHDPLNRDVLWAAGKPLGVRKVYGDLTDCF